MKPHIRFDANIRFLELLDQRQLPKSEEYIRCSSADDVIAAIKQMVVRGAPAIGVAAAWACCLAAMELEDCPNWQHQLRKKFREIAEARPTAVNLKWAVERMEAIAENAKKELPLSRFIAEAAEIQAQDLKICKKIGNIGAKIIRDGDTILTHCNAGSLATAGYGTALGVIRSAFEEGKKISVIADETRPLLQGSRLTVWELMQDHIPVTIACDNACALLMERKMINIALTGADRIALNGDTANKIGTCGIAIIAGYFNVPFYIAAPLSTIDPRAKTGAEIPIEKRAEEEVLSLQDVKLAAAGAHACNFAFDVTPANLITGIITEKGILAPPYQESIAKALLADPNE